MVIVEVATGRPCEVIVTPVLENDLKKLSVKRFFFKWKEVAKQAALFKLYIEGEEDIKGVMGLIDYPTEKRIEIRLLAVSKENVILKSQKGKKTKEYAHIAGNLIAYAGRISIAKYGASACISLIPKTELKKHYIEEYGMIDAGYQVFLELGPLRKLIEKYIL